MYATRKESKENAESIAKVMQEYGQPLTRKDVVSLTGLSGNQVHRAFKHLNYSMIPTGQRKPPLYKLDTTTPMRATPTGSVRRRTTRGTTPGLIAGHIQKAIEKARRPLSNNEVYHALLSSLPPEYARNVTLNRVKALLYWYYRSERLTRMGSGDEAYYGLKGINLSKFTDTGAKRVTETTKHYHVVEAPDAPAPLPQPLMEGAKAFQKIVDEYRQLEARYNELADKLDRIGKILGE